MKISLVVTSIDRQQDLDRFARSICEQTFAGEIEVSFVSQGRAEFRGSEFPRATVTLRTRSLPGPTALSRARNAGLADISGDIVGFPDDDCWFEPELLAKVAAVFADNRDLDCVCTCVYDPDRNRTYGNRPLGVQCPVTFRNLFRFVTSAGIFVRRSALDLAGAYFDEELGAGTAIGSGEEAELLARLLNSGCRIKYLGDLKVFHPVPEYLDSDIKKYYRYGVGFGYLNGRFLRERHGGVIPEFLNVAGRSIGGAILKFKHPVLGELYWNRFAGIMEGFVRGLRGTDASHNGWAQGRPESNQVEGLSRER